MHVMWPGRAWPPHLGLASLKLGLDEHQQVAAGLQQVTHGGHDLDDGDEGQVQGDQVWGRPLQVGRREVPQVGAIHDHQALVLLQLLRHLWMSACTATQRMRTCRRRNVATSKAHQ